jgi:predicted metalloprotease with PDZ domain
MITTATMRLFQLILQDELKLKSRVNFRKTKVIRYDGDSCFGDYRGESMGRGKFLHRVRFATSEIKNDVDLFATMAHEYVHAWQMENDRELDHDTASGFTAWRNYFMTNYGIDIVSMTPEN